MKSGLMLLALVVVFSTSCVTARATVFSLPQERVTECQSLCGGVGLKMAALVIIASASGCVCEPGTSADAPSTPAGMSSASKGATVAAAAAVQAAQQESQARR